MLLSEPSENVLFLLGGHDLEMCTVREILEGHNIRFCDKNLRWDNAKLSAYQAEIDAFISEHPDGKICGVELENDLQSGPEWYVAIDHHQELSNMPSALEQVLELLGLPMTRHCELVAANDKWHIAGLEKAGAAKEEIAAIRRADRQAQGVTEEDEMLAERSVKEKNVYGDLIVVQSMTSSFSPICDRLYPYDSLLIYNDDEFTYYGREARKVREMFSAEINAGKIYFGGGDKGYVGSKKGKYIDTEIFRMIKNIIDMTTKPYSYHIFYYPFCWVSEAESDMTFSERANLDGIRTDEALYWKRVQLDEDALKQPEGVSSDDRAEAAELFGERQYYFNFVHPVLYDVKGQKNALIHHYERVEPQEGDVRYCIEINKKKENKEKKESKRYELVVDAINLNLYSTGVGILSFYLKNMRENQKDEDSVRDINQFGRRIMPPHSGEFDQEHRSLLARSIKITGLKGKEDIKKRFDDSFLYSVTTDSEQERGLPESTSEQKEERKGLSDIWKPATFVENLIHDLSKELNTKALIDDRMIVSCLYGNDGLSRCAEYNVDEFINKKFWYQYVFVDNGSDVSCKNIEMKKKLIEDATYYRWQEYGTMYGVSRYSFVCLVKEKDFSFIELHMRTIYSRMMELILVQRASMLMFSSEVTRVSAELNTYNEKLVDKIGSIYKEYIRFLNQFYFSSVTIQDQGVELYELMARQFASAEKIKELDEKIAELHQFVSLKADEKRNSSSDILNWLAAFFLFPTLWIGVFSINSLENMHTGLCDFWTHILMILALSVVGWLLLYLIYSLKKKNKKHNKLWRKTR